MNNFSSHLNTFNNLLGYYLLIKLVISEKEKDLQDTDIAEQSKDIK